jgi:hypothetical protein
MIVASVAKSGRDKIQIRLRDHCGRSADVLVTRGPEGAWSPHHSALPAIIEMIGALLKTEAVV